MACIECAHVHSRRDLKSFRHGYWYLLLLIVRVNYVTSRMRWYCLWSWQHCCAATPHLPDNNRQYILNFIFFKVMQTRNNSVLFNISATHSDQWKYFILWICIFTALHGMQTRSSDENSVRPSVCLSICPSNAWIVSKRKKDVSRIFTPYQRSFNLVFWEKIMVGGRPLLPKILGQPAPIGAKSPILNW